MLTHAQGGAVGVYREWGAARRKAGGRGRGARAAGLAACSRRVLALPSRQARASPRYLVPRTYRCCDCDQEESPARVRGVEGGGGGGGVHRTRRAEGAASCGPVCRAPACAMPPPGPSEPRNAHRASRVRHARRARCCCGRGPAPCRQLGSSACSGRAHTGEARHLRQPQRAARAPHRACAPAKLRTRAAHSQVARHFRPRQV